MSDGRRRDGGRERRRPPKGLRYVVYAGLALVVLLMVALALSVYLGGSGPAGPPYPSANFTVDYDADADRVRVTHAGGTAFTTEETDRLYVTRNGTEAAQFILPVERNASVELQDVPPGTEIGVVWDGTGNAEIEIASERVGVNESAG